MDIHKNARLTPHGRERLAKMVVGGQTPQAASEAAGVCPRTGRKWRDRFEQEGLAGLQDRSSRPHRLRQPTPPEVIERIESLRRQRMPGKEIATTVGVSPATVSRVLQRLGLSKLSALEPAEPARRYEREQPGEMIHIDIKKLGKFNQIGHRITGDRKGQSNSRGVGWEFLHVCIDDASRVAFSKIMKTERECCAVTFLKAAVAYYKSLGITVLRVMTDNGSCYRSKAFARACRRLKLKHIRTKPYTPRTNGKAERFIQTSLREWAYARAYLNSRQRAHELPFFMHRYNWHRPHASIGHKPPISKLALTEDNLLELRHLRAPPCYRRRASSKSFRRRHPRRSASHLCGRARPAGMRRPRLPPQAGSCLNRVPPRRRAASPAHRSSCQLRGRALASFCRCPLRQRWRCAWGFWAPNAGSGCVAFFAFAAPLGLLGHYLALPPLGP